MASNSTSSLLSHHAVDISKRPTSPSRPVSEYDYWDARRRSFPSPFISDAKGFSKAFSKCVWLLGVIVRFFFYLKGNAPSTGYLYLQYTITQSKLGVTAV